MKLIFIQTGKTSEQHVADGVALYAGRVKRLADFEIVTIPGLKNSGGMSAAELRKREGQQQLAFLSADMFVVLLDEKGKEYSTLELAAFFRRSLIGLRRKIVFVSGGAWGFSPEVYARADMRLSLSRLTFPHQLVRLLFIEQLYRVLTVIKGTPYHHE